MGPRHEEITTRCRLSSEVSFKGKEQMRHVYCTTVTSVMERKCFGTFISGDLLTDDEGEGRTIGI